MPNLKDLKNRIDSVKSTQKITKAMQMVAAAKLRRAEERAREATPYAERMQRMAETLGSGVLVPSLAPKLMVGTGKRHTHLLVVITSDRGLCGGFNTQVVREVKKRIGALHQQKKEVQILCIGSKGHDQLKGQYQSLIVGVESGLSKNKLRFADAEMIALKIKKWIENETIDVCTLVYNRFVSVISQVVTTKQLVPLAIEQKEADSKQEAAQYEYEPQEDRILASLLPRNLAVQCYQGLLESVAGEQGARMSAMDNATRNAGDMIRNLTLEYNRSRQAVITRELIEIISGAEAL